MPAIIDATVGGPNSNSFETLLEAQAYFDTRLSLPGWDSATNQTALLIMATRVLDAMAQPRKILMPPQAGEPAYYRILRQWTGAPATATQKLAWPRTGMVDANGNAIPSNVIPDELKWAEAELAGQLGNADRTLDNDVIVQGLTSIRAGSVSLAFKNNIVPQVLPDAVIALMPYGWLTDELYQLANMAEFDVVSRGSHRHGDWGR
jgi:hypothetical protein